MVAINTQFRKNVYHINHILKIMTLKIILNYRCLLSRVQKAKEKKIPYVLT